MQHRRLALWLPVVLAVLTHQRVAIAQDATSQPISASQEKSTIEVTAAGLFDLHIRSTPIATVLEMLSYQARTGIVTSTSVTGSVSANLYGVTLEGALRAILTPNQLGYRKQGGVIYVATLEELSANQPLETRVVKLRYLPRKDAIRAIQGLGSKAGTVSPTGEDGGSAGGGGGGGGGSTSGAAKEFEGAGTEYLIITDTPDRLDTIETLLKEIDVRPKQVLIEATILRATLSENNQLGVDLTLLGGVDFQTVGSTSDAANNVVTGALPPDEFQQTTINAGTSLLGGSIQDGFRFGIIRNGVSAFIRALESVTDTTVLANPKVIALNRQEAEVIVGRRDGYLTTTVTQTAAIQSVEFLETGTQIRLRPVVNDDGTVRLDVTPKDSNGGLTADNLPFEETTEARAQLMIEDGHTVLIGGLFRERTVASRSQIPLLGDVPLIGAAFSKTVNETVREEVVILLTVHVLKDNKQEADVFREMLADVERIRVGTRKGLMFTGRERLAQAFYEEAIRQAQRGNADLALFNARCALHNQPRHIGAIKLTERTTETRAWESDTSRIRSLTLRLIQREHGIPPREGPTQLGLPEAHEQLLEPRWRQPVDEHGGEGLTIEREEPAPTSEPQ
ncbi:MAG: hypothetical protein ACKVS9_12430 [Phycisphaerae bacterium]